MGNKGYLGRFKQYKRGENYKMTGDNYRVIPFKEMKQALNLLYNEWFVVWRDVKLTEENWSQVVYQLVQITGQYDYPVVMALAQALLKELEERNKHDK